MANPRISAAVARLRLSPRESEIVQGISIGDTTQQVAETLGIEAATVRTHLRKIFVKLEIGSRVELLSVVLANVIDQLESEPHPPPAEKAATAEMAAAGQSA